MEPWDDSRRSAPPPPIPEGHAEPSPSCSHSPSESAEGPLSLGQEALWILHGLAPGSAAHTLAGAARLPEGADAALLGHAILTLVERHPALRATFRGGPRGPLQRIGSPAQARAAWAREDAAGWSAEELGRRVREEALRPFDLEQGPVLRAVLFDRGPRDPAGSVLVLALHHIAADFWSLAVLLRELGCLYAGGAAAGLPAPAANHAAIAARQRQELAAGRFDEMLAQARRQLAGAPPLDLPLDRPRPDLQTFRGARLGGRLGRDLALAAGALARRGEATLFMLLLAAFEALLARHGGQEDFLLGTPTSGRPSPELGGVVGCLVNPVPLRAGLAGDPDVLTLLARARRATLDALARQELPFSLLAREPAEARDPSRPAVFQAMLVLERSPVPELENLAAFTLGEGGVRLCLGGAGGAAGAEGPNGAPGGGAARRLTLESVALEQTAAQRDLTLLAAEIGGDLAAAFEWNLDLFDAATVRRMSGHLTHLLRDMTRHPERRLSQLAMLGPAEAQQMLREWNATAAPESARRLHELIEAQAARTPEAAAVAFAQEVLTYRELDARANRLARHLVRAGVGPDMRVGVCLPRSAELLVALLATLKAGGAFVPLDPSYPAARMANMIEDSRVALALTDASTASLLRAAADRTLLTERIDEASAAWRGGPDPGSPGRGLCPEQLAYVLFTSGSTGRPKGAMNSHRAIVNRLRWMQETFGLTAADRVLHKTPTSFDVAVWELFWPLLTGACLVVARPGGHLEPLYLRDEIARSQVTLVHFVPSLLHVFLEQPGLDACAGLRRVLVSGEALGRELAARFQAILGHRGIELHNLYGPAEAAVDVTWWPCEAGDARPVPIGRPLANVSIHLLDRHLRPVPLGGAGELHIGGVQVGRGYLGRPDLTAERFIPDPFAAPPGGRLYRTGDLARHRTGGELEYLGRLDHQVKLFGVRIELGEIEHALAGHEAVREAVVVARTISGTTRLVAYVVPAGPATPANLANPANPANPETVAAPATPEASANLASSATPANPETLANLATATTAANPAVFAEAAVPDAAMLRAHLLGKLPTTMIPSSWVFLPSLPLSPSGKVDRRALPACIDEPVATPWAAPVTATEKALAAIWSQVLRRQDIGIHDNFFSLGGDSITGMQVLFRASQAGIKLTPRLIFRHPTLAALAAAATGAGGHDPVTAAAPPASREGLPSIADFPESGLSERDLLTLMSSLTRGEQGPPG